jgi:hypothetical protein
LTVTALGIKPGRVPDNTTATVAGCIGVALGLLDDWLTGADPHAPSGLGQRVRLPAGHWLGECAAIGILVLARKGRAFGSLDPLIARQGGQHVLYGSASPSPPPPRTGPPAATRQSATWPAPRCAE